MPVTVAYALTDDAILGAGEPRPYGFRLGAYDPTLPLVIDPVILVYCGFIGGDGGDDAYGVAVDAAGYAYIVGFVASTEATFPETTGPDLTFNGDLDAFVAKVLVFNPTHFLYLPLVTRNRWARALPLVVVTLPHSGSLRPTRGRQNKRPSRLARPGRLVQARGSLE